MRLFQVNGDTLIYGGPGQEPAAARPFRPHLAQRGNVSHADPAARLSALSRRLLPALRDGELLCRGLRADCAGSAGLPAAGRFCAPHCAARAASRGAALATLWLAALCPFTASYAVAPLTETPTLFVLALAMWAMARFRDGPGWAHALWFTFAVDLRRAVAAGRRACGRCLCAGAGDRIAARQWAGKDCAAKIGRA